MDEVLIYCLLFCVVLNYIGAAGWGLYMKQRAENKELQSKIRELSKPKNKTQDSQSLNNYSKNDS